MNGDCPGWVRQLLGGRFVPDLGQPGLERDAMPVKLLGCTWDNADNVATGTLPADTAAMQDLELRIDIFDSGVQVIPEAYYDTISLCMLEECPCGDTTWRAMVSFKKLLSKSAVFDLPAFQQMSDVDTTQNPAVYRYISYHPWYVGKGTTRVYQTQIELPVTNAPLLIWPTFYSTASPFPMRVRVLLECLRH
jgi:hypothetical protein